MLYPFKILYVLWFKFSFGAKFLKLVQFLFSFVLYSLPLAGTKASKIETSSKNIKPSINLNHNICNKFISTLLNKKTLFCFDFSSHSFHVFTPSMPDLLFFSLISCPSSSPIFFHTFSYNLILATNSTPLTPQSIEYVPRY